MFAGVASAVYGNSYDLQIYQKNSSIVFARTNQFDIIIGDSECARTAGRNHIFCTHLCLHWNICKAGLAFNRKTEGENANVSALCDDAGNMSGGGRYHL